MANLHFAFVHPDGHHDESGVDLPDNADIVGVVMYKDDTPLVLYVA